MPVPPVSCAPLPPRDGRRIDTEHLRQQHPIADLVARYGIELKRTGASPIWALRLSRGACLQRGYLVADGVGHNLLVRDRLRMNPQGAGESPKPEK